MNVRSCRRGGIRLLVGAANEGESVDSVRVVAFDWGPVTPRWRGTTFTTGS